MTNSIVSFPFTFNFKSIGPVSDDLSKDALALLCSEFTPEKAERIRAEFSQVENRTKDKVWKRNTVNVQLTMPAEFAGADELVLKIIQNYIAAYARSEYVDDYEAVGSHTWAEIKAFAATQGSRSGSIEIAADVLKAMAASFQQFVAERFKSPKAGEKMGELLSKRCTVNAFKRYIGEATDTAFARVEAVLLEWAEWVQVNDGDSAEDCAAVYQMATRAITKNRKAEVIDVLSILG